MRVPYRRPLYSFGLAMTALFGSFPSFAQKAEGQQASNYVGSVVCKNSQLITADSVTNIQEAVRDALASGASLKVRSIAKSRSYSPVICPDVGGIVLNVEPLKALLSIDREQQTARVQPGMRIGDLQAELSKQGFAFPVTPDYNGVSLAGAMGTGAHNSSLQIPSAVGDWVEEIKLVDGRGEVQVLTGEALNAARVHLGLLGIIFELKIKIVPQFKLERRSFKLADTDIASESVKLARQYAYAKLHWFPTQGTYVVEALDKKPLSTPGDSFNNSWTTPRVAGVLQNFTFPIDLLNANKSLQCSAEALRAKTWASSYKAVDSPDDRPVGLSQNMIGGFCAEGTCAWDRGIKSRTIEAAFSLQDFPAWVQDVKELIQRRPGCFPLLGIYLRFSAPSEAHLGQAYGQETVMFEIHMPVTQKPTLESSSEVYDEILQLTLGKYQGRPHWGKLTQPYFDNIGSRQFPKFDEFRTLQKKLDPSGLFETSFWRSLGTSTRELPIGENCGVTRECLCSEDADCGKNATCEAGILFTEARICVKK